MISIYVVETSLNLPLASTFQVQSLSAFAQSRHQSVCHITYAQRSQTWIVLALSETYNVIYLEQGPFALQLQVYAVFLRYACILWPRV